MTPSRRTLIAALVTLAVIVSSFVDVAAQTVVAKSAWFSLEIEDEIEIDARAKRAIVKEVEKALAETLDLLGLTPKQAFYDGLPTPGWMGKAGRIRVVIVHDISEKRQGMDYWSTQLYAGGFQLELPAPGEAGVTAEYRRRIWRGERVPTEVQSRVKEMVAWNTSGIVSAIRKWA